MKCNVIIAVLIQAKLTFIDGVFSVDGTLTFWRGTTIGLFDFSFSGFICSNNYIAH